MFQDLEANSVYVKIIEYSIAGKCFLSGEIWKKILLRKRSSAFNKCMRSISTFKVLYKLNLKNLKIPTLYLYAYTLGNISPRIAIGRNESVDFWCECGTIRFSIKSFAQHQRCGERFGKGIS